MNRVFLPLMVVLSLSFSSCSQPKTSTTTPGADPNMSSEEIWEAAKSPDDPVVEIETSEGTIKAVLFKKKAPISVDNFLKYVKDKHYDGTIWHRVIKDFMIQGGGFNSDMQEKNTAYPPIKNEAANGLPNERGTLAMARTGEIDSATAQFFINTTDNEFLNHKVRDYGYAVFGKVTEGMDVVDTIRNVQTLSFGAAQDQPVEPVFIKSIRVVEPEK